MAIINKQRNYYWKTQLVISILDQHDQNPRPENIETMVDTKQQKVEKEIHFASTDNISGTSNKYMPHYISSYILLGSFYV